MKTGDNEKRKALKDFFESDLPICEKAFHDTFTDHSNVIPNMQTLSSFRDFQQKTNMVGILVGDVDLLSIVFKVHPDLAGCPGKPQSDSLKILQENRDYSARLYVAQQRRSSDVRSTSCCVQD